MMDHMICQLFGKTGHPRISLLIRPLEKKDIKIVGPKNIKMEQKTVDMILISIQNLQKDQKAMGTKFVKLTEAFKNTNSKMEKKNNEKFGMYEKRMNKIEEPLECLKVVRAVGGLQSSRKRGHMGTCCF